LQPPWLLGQFGGASWHAPAGLFYFALKPNLRIASVKLAIGPVNTPIGTFGA